MEKEPNIEDIAKNPENYFVLPEKKEEEDWSKYDPSSYDTEWDLITESNNAFGDNKFGISFYYLTLVLKYKNFEDVITSVECKLPKEKTEEVFEADYNIVVIFTLIKSDLRDYFKENNIDITFKKKSLEEQCKIIKEHSNHYSDYKKMKELFGTEFRPRNSFL
jgi:hypothetical protein